MSAVPTSKRPRHCTPEESANFRVFCDAQRLSDNLVIYSAAAEQCVTIAWPMHDSGMKVKPADFKDYVTTRGAHIECFCKANHSQNKLSFSTRIVHKGSGKVVVLCHDEPSTCGFYLDLSRIYACTKLTSDYRHLQPSSTGRPISRDAQQHVELMIHQIGINNEAAPYFEGFLGDIVPSVKQLSMGFKQQPLYSSARTRVRQVRERHSSTSYISSPSPSPSPSPSSQGGPSRLQRGHNSQKTILEDQQELLEEAISGEGIPTDVWRVLFEHCRTCDKTFLQAHFKAHDGPCFKASCELSDSVEE